MGVGIFWIGLSRADPGCCRLTLNKHNYIICGNFQNSVGENYGFHDKLPILS